MKENRCVSIITFFFFFFFLKKKNQNKTKKIASDVIFALTSALCREFHENTVETNNPQNVLFNLPKKAVTATSPWHVCPVQQQMTEQDTPVRRQPHQQLQSALHLHYLMINNSGQSSTKSASADALLHVSPIQLHNRGTGHVCSTTAASTDAASFAVA